MDPQPIPSQPQKSFIDSLPPKTAFIGGFVTAVLTLGTLGFVLLGGCLLTGSCDMGSALAAKGGSYPVAADPSGDPSAVPSPEPTSVPAVDNEDHIRGDKNAAITIVEYSDFQCPFCSRFHPTMQQVMKNYNGKVRWVFRHFPLSFHPNAEPAANASECASEQGKFWEFADALFGNQESLGDDFYKKTAADLGLNAKKFADCLSSGKYLEKVRAQSQSGASAGVNGTPGSFVIGEDGQAIPIKGALPYESVKAAIDSLL
jgi:protein-disulfide isomerase